VKGLFHSDRLGVVLAAYPISPQLKEGEMGKSCNPPCTVKENFGQIWQILKCCGALGMEGKWDCTIVQCTVRFLFLFSILSFIALIFKE
jgi:hypothetical protein